MLQKAIKSISIVFSLFVVLSCNKDKVDPKTNTEILVQNSWEISSASFQTSLGPFEVYKKNATNNLFDASKIVLKFKSDGTVTGTNQTGQSLTGNWSFNADETKMTLPDGLPFKDISIQTLTEKNFDIAVPNFSYNVGLGNVAGILNVKMTPKF